MALLVDIETVKRDLRITSDSGDDDVAAKIVLAQGIIADYVKRDLAVEFDPDASGQPQLPESIKGAILLAVRALYDGGDPLNDTVLALLHRQRDPAMA